MGSRFFPIKLVFLKISFWEQFTVAFQFFSKSFLRSQIQYFTLIYYVLRSLLFEFLVKIKVPKWLIQNNFFLNPSIIQIYILTLDGTSQQLNLSIENILDFIFFLLFFLFFFPIIWVSHLCFQLSFILSISSYHSKTSNHHFFGNLLPIFPSTYMFLTVMTASVSSILKLRFSQLILFSSILPFRLIGILLAWHFSPLHPSSP